MKKFKTRIMIIVAVIVAILYFTGDFSLIDIQKTAIIVALGIDKKDNSYEVTAQIAIPQATDQSSQNNDAMVSAEGDTVFQAIDNIGIKTGWQPKLSFCDLIVFGSGVNDDELIALIDHVIASQKLQNSAQIAKCENTAKETLSHTTALDAISSFAIQKILLKNTLKVNTVSRSNVREFAIMHYSPSNSAFMPLIKVEEGSLDGQENSSSSQMTASTGSSDTPSKSSEGEQKNVIYDATTTLVFSNGKKACELEKEETLLFNLLLKRVDESYLSVETPNGKVLLSITKSKHKITVDFLEKPTVNVKLDLSVTLIDSEKTREKDVFEKEIVSPEYLKLATEKVTDDLTKLYDKLSRANADVLSAKNYVYKFKHSKYNSVKDLALSNFNFNPIVSVKSLD
ncbi:MAG: hypothetical protein IJF75_00925 [Clostridia bacterium]|nr:hypothetical protein [Clostridia bacterium]